MKYKSKLEKDLAVSFKHEMRKYKEEYNNVFFGPYPQIVNQLRIDGCFLNFAELNVS